MPLSADNLPRSCKCNPYRFYRQLHRRDPVDFQLINGNLGRNVASGSAYARLDLSLIKTFPLKEQKRLELKADFFNVLNRTNFMLYNNLDTLNLMPLSADAGAGCD